MTDFLNYRTSVDGANVIAGLLSCMAGVPANRKAQADLFYQEIGTEVYEALRSSLAASLYVANNRCMQLFLAAYDEGNMPWVHEVDSSGLRALIRMADYSWKEYRYWLDSDYKLNHALSDLYTSLRINSPCDEISVQLGIALQHAKFTCDDNVDRLKEIIFSRGDSSF